MSRLRRPHSGSIGGPTRDSCSGSTSSPCESYRLSWYPRLLPPPMPGSATGAARAPPRSSTPCSSRRGRRARQGPRSEFPSSTVHQLEDELNRVQREMASMATAATTVVSGVTPAGVGGSATSAGTRASSNASPIISDGHDSSNASPIDSDAGVLSSAPKSRPTPLLKSPPALREALRHLRQNLLPQLE